MLICHCRAVNEATIRAVIRSGASDVDEVARRCGAGETCGGCRPAVIRLLADLPVRSGIEPVESSAA